MKLMLTVLSLLVAAGRLADAQIVDEVQISIRGFQLAANGAEKDTGVWLHAGAGPLNIAKPTVGLFSMRGCGDLLVAVPPSALESAPVGWRVEVPVGWRVEVTPTRVVNHAVTFRLRWVRALGNGSGLTPADEDVEVTLRPGESRPLDSLPVVQSGVTTQDGRPCETKAVSLRVVADFPTFDRRLIGMDVWLVERLPNGKEESQFQSLRGLPHRPISFYFDSVSNGTKRLDIFGKLVADPQQSGMEIAVEAIGAAADPGQQGYQSVRWFRSTLRMKPDEIVEVALPSGEKAGAFGNRVFSIRIRMRQIR